MQSTATAKLKRASYCAVFDKSGGSDGID